jgi:hypothetical protein
MVFSVLKSNCAAEELYGFSPRGRRPFSRLRDESNLT